MLFPFTGVGKSVIPYGSELRTAYGNVPDVDIYHRQGDGSYVIMNQHLRASFNGLPVNTITVDHGGVASGYIKISA